MTDRTRQVYEQRADDYARLRPPRHQARAAALVAAALPGRLVLDAGCGPGSYAAELGDERRGPRPVGGHARAGPGRRRPTPGAGRPGRAPLPPPLAGRGVVAPQPPARARARPARGPGPPPVGDGGRRTAHHEPVAGRRRGGRRSRRGRRPARALLRPVAAGRRWRRWWRAPASTSRGSWCRARASGWTPGGPAPWPTPSAPACGCSSAASTRAWCRPTPASASPARPTGSGGRRWSRASSPGPRTPSPSSHVDRVGMTDLVKRATPGGRRR